MGTKKTSSSHLAILSSLVSPAMAPVDILVEPAEVVLSTDGLSVSVSAVLEAAEDVPFRSVLTPFGLLSGSSM